MSIDQLEVTDPQARADIAKLQKEQYAQSVFIRENKECCEANTKRLDELLPEHNRRIGDLERHSTECDGKHELHIHHRRKSDHEMSIISTTLQESLTVNKQMQETLTKLLTTVEDHAPTVKRAKDTHTWWDKTRELLVIVALVYGATHGAEQLAAFFR